MIVSLLLLNIVCLCFGIWIYFVYSGLFALHAYSGSTARARGYSRQSIRREDIPNSINGKSICYALWLEHRIFYHRNPHCLSDLLNRWLIYDSIRNLQQKITMKMTEDSTDLKCIFTATSLSTRMQTILYQI